MNIFYIVNIINIKLITFQDKLCDLLHNSVFVYI
jgi:hypothetical protein